MQIRISPEQMMSRVTEYRTQGQNVSEVIVALDNLVAALDGEWEGAGKDSYINRYKDLRRSFVAAEQLIEEIAEALTNTANFYAEADASVKF